MGTSRWRRRFVLLAVPAVLALAAGSVAASAATAPRTGASGQGQPAEAPELGGTPESTAVITTTAAAEPTEPSKTTDPAEPAGSADLGHQDSGDQTDHQFDGQE